MALEVNAHVARLRRFQPFHADSGELVYEQSDPEEKVFETRTLPYLLRLLDQDEVRLIVLTGDAGHGKTSLCARVLVELGHTPLDALQLIRTKGDGVEITGRTTRGRPLRILKDLSDLDYPIAADVLTSLLDMEGNGVAIVSANEGRLRRVVGSYGNGRLEVLTRTLERGLDDGSLSAVDSSVKVINLNFQSVAPDDQSGLVDWAVRTWAGDRRRWQICGRCDAVNVCPIYANHRQLSEEKSASTRRTAIKSLFATAERTGAVVTTRQALAVISYAVTGGLDCTDVHKRWNGGPKDKSWQHAYLYHQAIFGDRLSRTKRADVPALGALRRLDPGRTALREVDDVLEPAPDETGFLPLLPTIDEGSPRSRREAQRESEVLSNLMRFLRRRDFFEGVRAEPTLTRRMGLQAADDFRAAARMDSSGSVEIRDKLLRGMEALQGVHRPGRPPYFLVLDPAFVTHRSQAAVVAQRIPSRNVKILPQRLQWSSAAGTEPELPEALEWLDRVTIVRIETGQATVPVTLDLLRFELLYRWAEGLSSRMQHEAEVRHFTSALAQLVPAGEPGDEITVLVNGERRTLTIDIGDLIRSGEG